MTAAALRAMRPGDADAVALLHATSWRSAYRGIVPDSFLDHDVFADRQTIWRERLLGAATAPAFGIVAEDAATGRMAGFAYVFPHHEPACGTLVDNLHVDPEQKGGGIGRRLLQAVVRELGPADTQPLHLWVLDKNEPAKRFYARLGAEFVDPGTTPPFGGVCLSEWRCIWRDPRVLLRDA